MDVEAICSGWLVKSPSSKYVTLFSRGKLSIRVPLKSKWHRRYFVLHKPHGSLPHQYAFDYFKDEHGGRRRGSINLEECETILSGLDTSHYPHLFSIKTKARHKDRVYYLAAESEEDMTRWVNYLCKLCGLKMGPSDVSVVSENHSVAPNPPVRHDSMQLTVDMESTQRAISNQSLVNEELSNQILEEIEAIEQGRLEVDSRPPDERVPAAGYTELADCTTGASTLPRESGDFAELYDVPRPQNQLAPPKRAIGQSNSVKGSRGGTLPDSLTGSRSANSSPRPGHRSLYTARSGEPLAPPRPPKPTQNEELYQNIGSNSPLLLRGSSHHLDSTINQDSSSLNNRIISHRHQTSAPDRFIFPSTNSLAINQPITNTLTINQPIANTLAINQPIPTSRGNSAANSPAATRRVTNSPTLKSPPVNGRASPARNISVDTIYYNTGVVTSPHSVSSNTEVVISPPPCDISSTLPPLMTNTGVIITPPLTNGVVDSQPLYSNSESASRREIESMYDVPKSLNISQPIAAPAACSANGVTVHKYVNAAAAAVMTRPARDNQNNEILPTGDSLGSTLDNEYDIRSQDMESGYDKPHRPPKPRNLSDTITLEDDSAFKSEHQILKVSKSNKTRAFTKGDSVFSDDPEEIPVSMTRSREEIKLPSRINTHDDSSTDSSSEDEDSDSTSTSPRVLESVYDVPSSITRPVRHQPQLPERLHRYSKPTHSSTVGNISLVSSVADQGHVKRSSSMSKVPMPLSSHSKFSSNGAISGGGNVSPKLRTHRSERSSSLSAGTAAPTDWRKHRINAPPQAMTGILPKSALTPPIEPIGDIQYVELDQSEDRGAEPSPLPNRASLSSVIPVGLGATNKSPELEYTDIDILKTQALQETKRERDMNLRKRSENDNID